MLLRHVKQHLLFRHESFLTDSAFALFRTFALLENLRLFSLGATSFRVQPMIFDLVFRNGPNSADFARIFFLRPTLVHALQNPRADGRREKAFAEFPVPVKIVLTVEDVLAFRAPHFFRLLVGVAFAHVHVALVLARKLDQAKTAAEVFLFRNGGWDRIIVDRVLLAVHLHVLV